MNKRKSIKSNTLQTRTEGKRDMNWNGEMADAYSVGLQDGKDGFRQGRPNDFEACYEQGWQHGKKARIKAMLESWKHANKLMAEYLNERSQLT